MFLELPGLGMHAAYALKPRALFSTEPSPDPMLVITVDERDMTLNGLVCKNVDYLTGPIFR